MIHPQLDKRLALSVIKHALKEKNTYLSYRYDGGNTFVRLWVMFY